MDWLVRLMWLGIRQSLVSTLGGTILQLISYLCAAFEEECLESGTGADQSLDAVLGHLITPRDVELLQVGTALTDNVKISNVTMNITQKIVYLT